jgi:hypothetical protein
LLLFTLSPSQAHAQANPTVGGGGACPDGAAYTPGGYAQIPVNDGIYTCSSGAWAPEALVVGSVDRTGAAPTCGSSTAGMLYYTGGTVEYCNGSSFTSFGSGVALSAITAAAGANTIASGSNAQVWNWALGATTNTGITFGETTHATAGSKIVNITTLATSTAVPLTITNGGASAFAINMSAGGLAIGGTNVIDLPDADTSSIAAGEGALANQDATGMQNTAIGSGAGRVLTNAGNNVAIGANSLYGGGGSFAAFGGTVAIGYEALYTYNGTGGNNTSVGDWTEQYMTTGTDDIAIGVYALQGVSAHPLTAANAGNIAIGDNALDSITGAATGNVAVGYNVLTNSTINSTFPNTAVGYESMEYATTATYNTAIGNLAMQGTSANPMTGSGYNVAIGDNALVAITGAAATNTAIGASALQHNSSGSSNVAVGQNALYSNITGTASMAIGQSALYDSTVAPNTAIGYQAGYYITTGSDNVAIGYDAMESISAHPLTAANAGNLAVGDNALMAITGAAAGNVAVGYNALANSTINSTNPNTAVGYEAMQYATTGTNNTAVGYTALQSTSAHPLTGDYNTAVGDSALNSLTGAADHDTAIGYHAGTALTSGTDNTLVGYEAGLGITTGSYNIILGEDPNSAITTGSTNILIGNSLTNVTNSSNDQLDIADLITGTIGSSDVGINSTTYEGTGLTLGTTSGLYLMGATSGYTGFIASATTTSSTYTLPAAAPGTNGYVLSSTSLGVMSWVAVGSGAYNNISVELAEGSAAAPSLSFVSDTKTGLYQAASASHTLNFTSNGAEVAAFDSTGDFNLTNAAAYEINGNKVLFCPDNDSGSIAVGVGAGAAENAADSNTAVGYDALTANTSGQFNTAVGADALAAVTTGSDVTAVGYKALYNNTGSNNSAFGYEALLAMTTGSGSLAAGYLALGSATGSNNTAVGYEAGYAGTALTTGTSNVYIGYDAEAKTATDSNTIVIGASTTSNASSNAITIGNTSMTASYVHVAFTTYSDGRHKKDIEDSDLGLDFIEKLRPVSYRFNNGDETLRYGFIAQEVEAALPPTLRDMVEKSEPEHGLSLIVRERNDEGTYHMTYDDLISPLVKSVQQLKATGDTKQRQINNGQKKEQDDIADLKHLIVSQQQEIEDLRKQISTLASRPQK